MSHFAVLDTETTWSDEVMSLGFVIADEDGFEEVCGEYYIVDPWIFRFERANVPANREPVFRKEMSQFAFA